MGGFYFPNQPEPDSCDMCLYHRPVCHGVDAEESCPYYVPDHGDLIDRYEVNSSVSWFGDGPFDAIKKARAIIPADTDLEGVIERIRADRRKQEQPLRQS